jgi:hypothetical protein
MGGRIADQARQVFFRIPAQVFGQPAQFGRQLHIAFDLDRRRLACQDGLQGDEWRFGGDGQ